MPENTDQNNSEYGHFLGSVIHKFWVIFSTIIHKRINPLQANVRFLYLLKTAEKIWLSNISRGNGADMGIK